MPKPLLLLLATALILAAGAAGYFLLTPPPPPSVPLGEPTPDAAADDSLETLLADLSSNDAASRKAAETHLSQLPYQKRSWLQRHADDTINLETRAALLHRLEELDEQLATKLPPISLHVSHATLSEVVSALNQEMATDLKDVPSNGGAPEPAIYTLDATNQPFWDVIIALNKQRPFQIAAEHIPGNPGGGVGYVLRAWDDPSGGMGHYATSGPLFCFAYTRDGGWGPRAQEKNDFRVDVMLLCDPRLPVADLSFGIPNVKLGADSNGNQLALSGWGPAEYHNAASGVHVFFTGPRPTNAGITISTIKVNASYTTAVADSSLDVPDIQQKAGWQGQVGDVTIRMPRLAGDSPVEFQFEVTPPEKAALVTLSLFQNDNWLIWSSNGSFANPQGILQGREYLTKPPMAAYLHVALAKRTHNFSAQLEIKDVPLPLPH